MQRPTLHIYKSLLRGAKTFPSVNRESIIEEIKIAFRENRNETDEKKLFLMFREAEMAQLNFTRFEKLTSQPSMQYTFEVNR